MSDNQRLLLAFGLTLLVFAGYQAVFVPPAPPASAPGAPTAVTDSAVPATPPTAETGAAAPVEAVAAPAVAPATESERATTAVATRMTLATSDATLHVAGTSVVGWSLADHAVAATAGAALVDLCEGQPDGACLRFGFAGLGDPDRVEALGSPPRGTRAIWTQGEARLVAALRPLGDHQLGLSFTIEGETKGVQAQPWVELGARLEGAGGDYVFRGLRFRRAGEVESIKPKDLAAEHRWDGRFDWLMWDDKYFARAFLPGDVDVKVAVASTVDEDGHGQSRMRLETAPLVGRGDDVPAVELRVFGGPKEIGLLQRIGRGMQDSIDFGMTGVIGRPILSLLHVFERLTGNYGWAIIVLTIAIKFALYPLTRSSMRSMQAMSKLRPRMQELQTKYKSDPARLNQEMMALYKNEKVNPLGGCLPMILQIPIFFALYRVLLVSIELRHAPFVLWVHDLAGPELLYTLAFAGFDLPIRVLPILMGASMLLQRS